jgi:hypothetical protein
VSVAKIDFISESTKEFEEKVVMQFSRALYE